jgi:hypothetical protein
MRAHFRAPVQDSAGDLLPGAVVSVYQNGTTTLISNPVWADSISSNQLGNPFITLDGNCDFYLDNPQRVDLSISAPGQVPYPVLDVDVNAAGATSLTLTFPGSATSTTQLGASAVANQAKAVALGDSASATGGSSTAAGQNAQASSASATALGQGALASGTQSVAAGAVSLATATQATAVGQAAQAGTQGATAIGSNASAQGTASTAIGLNAVASAAHQVVLGTVAEDAVLAGGTVFSEAVPATPLASSGTISFASPGQSVVPCSAAGNCTGLILAPATLGGQSIWVINESAFTMAFAASGTSNVADGTGDVIAATTARQFIWDANTSLWYRVT